MTRNRTAWWVECNYCACTTIVVRNPDDDNDTPEPEEWNRSWWCMVCGVEGTYTWTGEDVRLV